MAMKTTLLAALLFASPAFGSIYWNNGNPDLQGDLLNGIGLLGGSGNSLVYDDFVVGAGGATVTGVFSNDALGSVMNLAEIGTAFWEIRSGVSDGNGGTLVASGTGAANVGSSGVSILGNPIYQIGVNGLNVSLTPGTYWLAVAPDVTTSGISTFIATTAGAGGVGTPQAQNGNSFINSDLLGLVF
ncbi:MAG TPA: hypothetical protein VHW24_15760, partial [Bryobacteraceae bacterium]|nr:hypothetical protein [Bryobacteraceae bacterium]